MRFAAPDHVTDITLSIGPVPVVDGHVEVPDDLGQGDLGGLAMHGFTRVAGEAPAPSPVKAPKTEQSPENPKA